MRLHAPRAGGAWRSAAGLLCAALALPTPAASSDAGPAAPPARQKVLRYAFPIAETGFDPAQITDLYSRTIVANILEAPLTYDYLARPALVVPQTAAALPEVSDDYRRFVFTLRPGIHFADDPAFGGKPRELVAADYVYSLKRHYDPRFKSGNLFQFENAKLLGLSELRAQSIQDGTPFPYDTEVAGARVLDRYRFEIRLAESNPRFPYVMADAGVTGAVAREVIEAYPGREMEHPVGTGPYRLAEWRRSSRIVLERNPGFREQRYTARAPADDAGSLAIAKAFEGKRLPLIDRVEVAIIEETQPRWLGFLNTEFDMLERLPSEYARLAIPNDELAPNLKKRGVVHDRAPLVDVGFVYFNMEHPVVGGYTPEKVALRRALSLAFDVEEAIERVLDGQAIPAQAIVPPLVTGYDPALKTEMSEYSPARAQALLDLYGYVDRDGDGWRDQPDGSPLRLEYSTQPDQLSRRMQELWSKYMREVGVRIDFRTAKWPENLKASRAGQLMMWGVAWAATSPDGTYFLDLMYGPNKGQSNHARFDQPAFNALYERQRRLPDGPAREALIDEGKKIGVAFMPYKLWQHRIATDLMHPWVVGYQRHPFLRDWWRFLDIDLAAKAALQ